MTTKVYAVYSIPKSPEYKLERLFKTKEAAKAYIKFQKDEKKPGGIHELLPTNYIFDLQIEEIYE